jgi:hypothetical protein
MRRKQLVLFAAVALGVILSTASLAMAHHAFAAEFDREKPVTLRGTVTKMEWINPHAWLHVAVKNADGSVTDWAVEMGAPNALIRRGFTKASVPTGMEIIVNGFQAKDGSHKSNGSNITLGNGQKLFVGSGGTGAPEGR